MKTNEQSKQDLRIEEIEERAVDKSNLAKTAAIAGVMGVAGAGLAVAASQVILDSGEEENTNTITMDDLTDGATQGAEETKVIIDTPKGEEPSPEPPVVPPHESSLTVEEQVNLYDNEGNLTYSSTHGHYEGKEYVFIDSDGDRIVDRMGYDANGNHIIEENEMRDLDPSEQFLTKDLGQADHVTDIVGMPSMPEPIDPEPGYPGDIVPPSEDPLPVPDKPEPEPDPEPEPEPESEPHDFIDDDQDYNNDADVSDFI